MVFAALLLCNVAAAQHQNSLSFDGVDDNVTVQNASGLIANSQTKISLSCWVFAKNVSPAFPDFDGLVGFRNELDCDFYILQLSATTIEARFRNNSGTTYTLAYNGLQLNTWQHFVFSYDGTQTKLYSNGIAVDSIAASGDITNPNVTLTIGDVQYQSTHFYLNGNIDEVGLWNRNLSNSEVNCIYKAPVNTNSNGLMLYYDFNNGTANDTNTTLDTLDAYVGNIAGILNNFALADSVSNWTEGVVNYTATSQTICEGQTYLFNGQNLDSAGIYTATVNAVHNCDSLIILNLQVLPGISNTTITQNINTLHANQDSASYQWLKCTGTQTTIIAGANAQNYIPTSNGSYAVQITKNNCVATSTCFQFIMNGIEEFNETNDFIIYPNPAKKFVNIALGSGNKNAAVKVVDLKGKVVLQLNFGTTNLLELDVTSLSKGIYMLEISNDANCTKKKLVIE
jgi:hypothetical protein